MPDQLHRTLPSDFVWGTATASYQIEGATNEDGRGESVWDRFAATPGKVRNGDTGAVACDFYHRYRDDIALLRELGVDAFRFSIAWPRVIPTGRGAINAAGLDFYDRLVDELLGNGIAPYVTLFHWDTPQPLEDAGGWPARDYGRRLRASTSRPSQSGSAIASSTGSRTTSRGWSRGSGTVGATTLPGAPPTRMRSRQHTTYCSPTDAPSRSCGVRHPASQVGITLNLDNPYPAGPSEEDAQAVRWVDGLHNRWFLDPIFKGSYPEDMLEAWAAILPEMHDGDLETIAAPIDFLGVNNYTSPLVAADENGGRSRIVRRSDVDRTDMGWEVVPEGLHDLLVRLHRDYSPPAIYVTENGAAFPDVRGHDGSVHDPERESYLQGLHRCRSPRDRRRRAAPRLLRVVAARQLRVGLGLLEAVRSRLRRLRDARAGAEGQLLLVPRLHRRATRNGNRLGGRGVGERAPYSGRSSPGRMR